MKQSKRILSLIMVVGMLVGLISTVSAVEATDTYGVSIGTGVSAIADRHSLVFGNDSAQWLVLDADQTTVGNAGVALIAENIVANDVAFNAGGLDNAWANSGAKSWLADYAVGAFSASDLVYIMDTTKEASTEACFEQNWGEDALSAEKLFFLSAEEVEQYFYNDSIDGLIATYEGATDGWWLRSAYADRDIYAGVVSDAGFVGYPHIAATWGARPAFNISADLIAVSSASVGGKISGEVGADALTAVAEAQSPVWKLTLIDDAHSAFTATIGDGSGKLHQTSDYDTWQLPIAYEGARTGDNEYVSVMICNQAGNAIYYGHIAANSESGSVNVNMPAGLSGIYTVYAFAEQCNGDNVTDYGSQLVSAEMIIDDNMSSIDSWGLTLEGDIQADFLVNLTEDVVNDPNAYVSVRVDGIEKKHNISDITPNDNGLYMISANVAAAQMTEDISIQVVANGKEGSEYLYSVRGYSDYILSDKDSDEDLKNLVKAMLSYGGKAQDYFSHNMNDLADNGIAISSTTIPYTEDLGAVRTGSSSNVVYYGASLVHKNQTAVRFYFISNASAIEKVTFSVQFKDGSVIDDLEAVKSGSFYYIEVSNITPDALCDDMIVSVDGLQVTYSPFRYMHRMYYKDTANRVLRDLMQAMYDYYQYAVAYVD